LQLSCILVLLSHWSLICFHWILLCSYVQFVYCMSYICVSTCRFFLAHKMKCNACWRDLEGQAISTTCGHLLCMNAIFSLSVWSNSNCKEVEVHMFCCYWKKTCLILTDTSCAGTEDAKKILSNDGACPICDQVLSKSWVVNPWYNIFYLLCKLHFSCPALVCST
jgi:hypothetical protein